MLHVSTARLRELMDQRKIYYADHYGKRTIPKKAIERELRQRLAGDNNARGEDRLLVRKQENGRRNGRDCG